MSKFVRSRDLAGYRPDPEALAAAPLLQRWFLADERSGDGAALHGVRARDRARVETDCVVAVDVREGWAHTNGNGLWRLDAPADLKRVRHHSLLCWRPETAERADDMGFSLPPPHLVPAQDLYDDVKGWRALAEWYDDRLAVGDDELCV